MTDNDRQSVKLTQYATCGGCAAKLGPAELAQALAAITHQGQRTPNPNILAGLSPPDDGFVYRIDESRALIQTLDFFPPLVDDPYEYGLIAGANATGDIYAMGGEVVWALNIVAFPEELSLTILEDILRGGSDAINEAGGFIAGGHSIRDREPKYGLAVTGIVDPDRVWHKSGARVGDALLLTKPLGTGIILSAAKAAATADDSVRQAITQMVLLNKRAAKCLSVFNPSAVTDVTGFGLLGHACEMADQSHVRLSFQSRDLPLLEGVLDLARMGIRTSADERNREHFHHKVEFGPSIDPALQALLYDPQTSGGLLVSISPGQVDSFISHCKAAEQPVWCIGEVRDGDGVTVS